MIIFCNFVMPLCVSTLLIYASENINIVFKNRKVNWLLIVSALLIPSIVSSTRQIIDIGDSALYGELLFKDAFLMDWKNYIQAFHETYYAIETGYLLLSYVISKVTTDYQILFWIISVINLLLVYFGIKKIKLTTKQNCWMGMFAFYFLFFGQTLNIVRQSLSLAIVVFGAHYIFEKKFVKFCVVVIFAMQFHISAALAIGLYFLYFAIRKSKNKETVVMLICGVVLTIVMLYPFVFSFLKELNILPSKFYTLYSVTSMSYSPFAIITKLPLLLFFRFVIMKKFDLKEFDETNQWFFFSCIAMDLIISQLGASSAQLYRMAFVFGYMKPIVFAIVCKSKFITLCLIVYCLMYFIMEYIYQGALPAEMFQ